MVGNQAHHAFQFLKTTPRCDEPSNSSQAGSTARLDGTRAGCHETSFVPVAGLRRNVFLDSPFHRTFGWQQRQQAGRATKKRLSGVLIAARLQQNIDDISVLIHGTPKILLQAVDSDKEFVQKPRIAEATLLRFQFSNVVWTELQTPASNRFMRDAP